MLVYITKHNFSKIVRKIPLNSVNLEGQLYARYNQILNTIFSKYEKTELLLYKMLSEDPKKFLYEVYAKVQEKEDTYTWVYEENKKPCYHGRPNCPRLNSSFENYKIPLPIKYKGIITNKPLEHIVIKELLDFEQENVRNNVDLYRSWWKTEGELLYKSNIETFLMRVNMKFQPEPRIKDIKEFKQENSGVIEFDNYTSAEIERRIDEIIIAQRDYFKANEKHSSILRAYVKSTFQVLVRDYIPKFNSCDYSEVDIKSVLKEYNEKFKDPLKILLKNYFRIKNNPDLKIESRILDELGFSPCGFPDCFNLLAPSEDIFDANKFIEYEKDEYELFLNFFLKNISFAKTFISMYYPFTYQEIIERWNYLEHGDAHYTVYLYDIESSIRPKLGLSFNKNIRWNSKLKAKYEYGYIDPFNGYIVGTHTGNVELEERDYQDDILPIDIINDIKRRNNIMLDWFFNNDNYENYDYNDLNLFDLDLINKVFPKLSYEECKNLFDKTSYVFFSNKSIWENTFSKIINLEFCDKILGYQKSQHYYIDDELPY